MMTSARSVADEVDNALDYMVKNEISIYRRPLIRDNGRVTWLPNSRSAQFLPVRSQHSVALYRYWLENGQYSTILFDGSLIQITYEWVRSTLLMHRLAYVPAPAHVDADLFDTFPIFDVIEVELADIERVRFASAIRFEYDLAAAGPNHPAAHMTVNEAACRIPCVTPMRFGMFMRFVLEHFYPGVWKRHSYFHNLTTSAMGHRPLTTEEADGLHMAWPM